MNVGRVVRRWWVDVIALVILGIVFVIPFVFILFIAGTGQKIVG